MLKLTCFNKANYSAEEAARSAYLTNRHYFYNGFYHKGYIEIRNNHNLNQWTAYFRKQYGVHRHTELILTITDMELWVAPEAPIF